MRYLSLRLEDDSFVHVVETAAETAPARLPKLAAFKAFQSGIRERCVEPPVAKVRPSSAITGCWARTERRCGRQNETVSRGVVTAADIEQPARRDAAKTASLLRAHGRLGDRRRGRAAGCADQGGGGVCRCRADRQSRRLAVPDRAQHRAGFPAPAQPAGSAAVGRGGGHDCRSARCRRPAARSPAPACAPSCACRWRSAPA